MLISHIFKHHPTANKREFSSLSETIEHEEQNWLCPYCNRKYLSSGKRREHIKKSHPGKEIPPSIKKAGRGEANVKLVKTIKRSPNECPYCPMEYSHRTKLLKHCKGADLNSIFFLSPRVLLMHCYLNLPWIRGASYLVQGRLVIRPYFWLFIRSLFFRFLPPNGCL